MAYAEDQITLEVVEEGNETFVEQPATPYGVGDLWVDTGEKTSELVTDDDKDIVDDDANAFVAVEPGDSKVYVCKTPSPDGTFNQDDWQLAATDDAAVEDLNQFFWYETTGDHAGVHITEIPQDQFKADPASGGGNLLARSNGIAVRDGVTELATFSGNAIKLRDGASADAVVIQNYESADTGTVIDNIIDQNDDAGIGVYSHALNLEYLGGLSVTFAFADPAGNVIFYDCRKTIALANFGSWSIDSETGFEAAGTIAFNSTTHTVTLTVATMSGNDAYRLIDFRALYTSYPHYSSLGIGSTVDLTDVEETALAVGVDGAVGNSFEVSRHGDITTLGSITAGGSLFTNDNTTDAVGAVKTDSGTGSVPNTGAWTSGGPTLTLTRGTWIITANAAIPSTGSSATRKGVRIYEGGSYVVSGSEVLVTSAATGQNNIQSVGIVTVNSSMEYQAQGWLGTGASDPVNFTFALNAVRIG